VDALVIGTGGARGWPEDGCRCASCMRARSAGRRRAPGRVLIDDWLEVVPGRPLLPGTGPNPATALHIERVVGGLDITGPDGGRLLVVGGPGEIPAPPPAARPYDIALLDLLASPTQLGCLRARGLVHERTAVAALYTDHRISSEEEMARRCALWAADQANDGQLINGPAASPAPRAARPHRTLIVGGARSGKSTEAELRLAAEPDVTYLAAGPFAPAGSARPGRRAEPGAATNRGPDESSVADGQSWTGPDGGPDTEWAHRVAVHRARRPGWWRTVESLNVAEILRAETGVLLIDGIGTWLAAVLDEAGMWAADVARSRAAVADSEPDQSRPDPASVVRARIEELVDAWRQTSARVVAVTDQVGSGLVPAYPAGRVFRDQLGWLNQRLAAESELTLQVVAGRATMLPG
jgi:adenosylcobinamide kinase / adenosylcobinamide-phosphate guanylyltransferase